MPQATLPVYWHSLSTRTTYSNFCFHNLVGSAAKVAEFFLNRTHNAMKRPEPPALMYGTPEMLFRRKKEAAQQTGRNIEVVAAVIRRGDTILATQRGYGPWEGWWEFPGGKIQPGESREEALLREIQEEMDTAITIDRFLTTVDYEYPDFHLTMHCFLCHLTDGSYTLKEHHAARWLDAGSLQSVQWLPADQDLVTRLVNLLQQ